MNCREFEGRIALHVGGDLDAGETTHVIEHLDVCAPCRRFADQLRRDRDALVLLAGEILPDSAYAAVRRGVMEQVRPDRRRWPIWAAAAAALVCATLALSILWQRTTAIVPAPPMPSVAVKAELPPYPPAPPPRRKRVVATSPQPQLVVKIVTDDPNLVIYWISESTGE
jgi:anti-sigma factor RsiW